MADTLDRGELKILDTACAGILEPVAAFAALKAHDEGCLLSLVVDKDDYLAA